MKINNKLWWLNPWGEVLRLRKERQTPVQLETEAVQAMKRYADEADERLIASYLTNENLRAMVNLLKIKLMRLEAHPQADKQNGSEANCES